MEMYKNIIKLSIPTLLFLGVGIYGYHFFYSCKISIFFVILWSFITSIRINKEIDNYKFSKYIVIMIMLINILYSIYYFINTNSSMYWIKCIGYYKGCGLKSYSYSYYYDVVYYDYKNTRHCISDPHREPYRGKIGDCFLIFAQNDHGRIISTKPTLIDLEKYKYPVPCISKNIEVGNDSYEYAKYSPDIAYNSFGLNIVLKASTYDSSYISFYDLKNKIQYIGRNKSNMDTILVYFNINPEFYTGWHICPDSLCTSENYDKVLEGGYGYLFRGKIYSKEETEKYWNIIEQYKLRNANEN
jgi:hypothetical protein